MNKPADAIICACPTSVQSYIQELLREVAVLKNRIILEDEICEIFGKEAQRLVDLPES